jgi:hypothetical protein
VLIQPAFVEKYSEKEAWLVETKQATKNKTKIQKRWDSSFFSTCFIFGLKVSSNEEERRGL